MRQEVKERFVADLRSGNFNQTIGYLKKDNGYEICHCQGGILVEQAVEAGVTSWQLESTRTRIPASVFGLPVVDEWGNTQVATAFPTPEVLEWAEIQHHEYALLWKAVDMNDQGKPFAEIADFVEENF